MRTMKTFDARKLDFEAASTYLNEEGYVVLEGLLDPVELEEIKRGVETIFDRQRKEPYDPDDGTTLPDEETLRTYFAKTYKISEAELERLVHRVRHTHQANWSTPWPVPLEKMDKSFLHLPTLFDHDRSERIWNLPMKLAQCGRVIEDPVLLRLMRSMLGEDCLLSDVSATSIGPHTSGGAWHIDAPLTQLSELLNIPITAQNAWMLDDFTPDNGATRVVPRSHRSGKKPPWGYDDLEGQIALTAPAGSLAIWLSQTWHRSGPNVTDAPRRALLGYYSRSWVKPFTDFTRYMSQEIAESYSPTARYLLGWAAYSPDRG